MPAHIDTPAPRPRGPDGSGNAIEHAFVRLARPQKVLDLHRPRVPTKLSLLQNRPEVKDSRHLAVPPLPQPSPPPPSLQPPGASNTAIFTPDEPSVAPCTSTTDGPAALHSDDLHHLGPVVTLGKFAQDGVEWGVRAQRGRPGLIMVKRLQRSLGLQEKYVLDTISHKNVVRALHTYWEGDVLCLAFEYCRVTLAEILHVHLRLEELHVQHIARSIFGALRYLGDRGIMHHGVEPKAIRLTTPDLRIVLANFEHATQVEPQAYLQCDLIDLGIVLLECMEGHLLSKEKRKIQFIRDQRGMNKVFGLTKPEHWSGCKNLIDFLDDLFNEDRAALVKLSKPHRFVSSTREDRDCMRPYAELVALECFTLWTAGR